LASASLSGRSPKPPMPVARSLGGLPRLRRAGAAPTSFPGASPRLYGADAAKWLRDSKRPSSASVYPAGGNTGGNEVGTNRVRGWPLVSAPVTSKMASLQAIARGHRRSGRLGRPPTEPKVTGSNPLGRVSVLACKPVFSRSQRHVAGVERVPHKCPKRLTSALPCPLRPRDLARCRRRPGEPRWPGSPRRCARGVSRSIAGPRTRCFRRAAPRPSAHWSCAARDAGGHRARTATRTSYPSCRSRRPPAPGRPVRRPANSRTGSRPRAST
jgi:hypothetical protein